MSSFFENLKLKFEAANVVSKTIYIILIIFAVTLLFNTLSFFFNTKASFFVEYFALSSNFDSLLFKPWTIITYGFLHDGFLHILFNLIVLFYFGNLFLDYFSSKQFLNYFFLGVLFGGMVFLLSYNFLPALKDRNAILVGASAGVMSVLVGIATLMPDYAMRFQFIGFVKLKYIALLVIGLDLLQIPMGNAGGHLAHLGGALIGFILTNQFLKTGTGQTQKGKSIFGKGIKKSKLKTVYKSNSTVKNSVRKSEEQQKIDAILDKISKSGYEALSKEEKQFLFEVGKK